MFTAGHGILPHMPLYYFDTECGDRRYEDPDGIDLASLEEARRQLEALLRDLTFDGDTGSATITARAQVRCDGAVVLRGSCTLTIDR